MRRFVSRVRRSEGGFTLTEVLVGMLLMAMVVFALHSMFDMSIRVFSSGNDTVRANENARSAIDRMEREIRAAWNPSNECSASATGASLIDSASGTNGIVFHNCLPGNATPTRIEYSLDGGRLMREQGGSAAEPLANLGGSAPLEITYFDGGNAPVPPSGPVAAVRIKLTTESGQRTQELITNAALRNRET